MREKFLCHNPWGLSNKWKRFAKCLFLRKKSFAMCDCEVCGKVITAPKLYSHWLTKTIIYALSLLTTYGMCVQLHTRKLESGFIVIAALFFPYMMYRIISSAILSMCHWQSVDPSKTDKDAKKDFALKTANLSAAFILGFWIAYGKIQEIDMIWSMVFLAAVTILIAVLRKKSIFVFGGVGVLLCSVASLLMQECCGNVYFAVGDILLHVSVLLFLCV